MFHGIRELHNRLEINFFSTTDGTSSSTLAVMVYFLILCLSSPKYLKKNFSFLINQHILCYMSSTLISINKKINESILYCDVPTSNVLKM